MAFKRRSFRRRRRYTRKRIPRAVRYYVRKQINRNIEDKGASLDLVSVWGTVPNSWVERCPSRPSQGAGMSSRVGRRIQLTSFYMYGVVAPGIAGTATDDTYNVMRIVIALWDSRSDNPLTDMATSINAPIRKDNSRGLIRKYYDKYITLSPNTSGLTGVGFTPGNKIFKYYKRFKRPIGITFADDTNVYPTLRWVISMISDSAVLPNPGFIAGYYVIKFQDA